MPRDEWLRANLKSKYGRDSTTRIKTKKTKLGNYTLKFGRHKGVPIRNIPSDYLMWLMKEEVCTGSLQTAVEFVMAQRNLAIKINKSYCS